MTEDIKTERRWLRSVIAASADPLPSFPWMRGQRRKPAALTLEDAAAAKPVTPQHVPLFSRGSVAAR